jgi:uncharacterized glyoxalase superfamily protein PhnB
MKQIECVVPILNVAEIASSVDYYVRSLGFQVEWQHRDGDYVISGISRDGYSIYLCERGQGNLGTWLWIGVDDVGGLYDEFLAAGANIVMVPTDFIWGREFRVADPDGHVIRFCGES